MQAERAYLHEVVFPRVSETYQQHGHTLEIVDPRLTANDEEEAEGIETLEHALDEVESCRPHFLCLLGTNYGKVILEVPDAVGRKHPAVRHFFRTSRVHLETLVAVIRDPERAEQSFFYYRKSEFLDQLFAADKQHYVPNNKMEALNEVETHKLEIFKEAIGRTNRPIFAYDCQWDSTHRQVTGFDQLGARVENDLLSIIGLAEAPAAGMVEETVPGSMLTEEVVAGTLAAGAIVAGAAVAGGALGRSKVKHAEPETAGMSAFDDAAGIEHAVGEATGEPSPFEEAPAYEEAAAYEEAPVEEGAAVEEPVAEDETVISDGAVVDDAAAEAAAEEILSGDDYTAPGQNESMAGMVSSQRNAEAAAAEIFGGMEEAPAANPDDNPFEVDTPAEEEASEEIVAVEEAAEEEEPVEVAAEEEEPAPKKKKKGWFGR
jgi:hypothetical protein